MSGRIAVVDLDNRFVRWELRRTIHEQRLYHRSVHVLVFDHSGSLYLQRRHASKQTYPRHWDSAVAGHVEESDYLAGPDEQLDRVYRDVAARELMEELGVVAPLEPIAHLAPTEGVHYEQARVFKARSAGPFTLQADEVEEGRWFTPEEVDALLREGREPVTRVLAHLVALVRERGLWG